MLQVSDSVSRQGQLKFNCGTTTISQSERAVQHGASVTSGLSVYNAYTSLGSLTDVAAKKADGTGWSFSASVGSSSVSVWPSHLDGRPCPPAIALA